MKFQEKQIKIKGNVVSYIDEGNSGKLPLILIHGFPFNKRMWKNQISVFKDQYRTLAYDVRGHGNSDPGKEEYTIPLFAKDLFLFMDALQIDRAIIGGLSMGGYIALNAVLQQPERIAALILCDSQCGPDTDQVRKGRMDTIDSIRQKGLDDYASNSITKLFSKTSLTSKTEEVAFIKQTILDTKIETICDTLMALAERKETCSGLPLIRVPVLIMVGEEDQITPPEAAQKMHQLISGAQLHIINDAGHVSNLENEESFNSQLELFLRGI
jgi:3-oxoadipate enol-lactonase